MLLDIPKKDFFFLLFFLLFFSLPLFTGKAAAFETKDLIRAGSGTRLEREAKIAYLTEVSARKMSLLKTEILKALRQKIAQKKFCLPFLLGKKYKMPRTFTDFIFDDTYLDTKDLKLLSKNSAYRLRYRYKETMDFKLFAAHLGFLSKGQSRVEVQFKGPYKRLKDGIMEVYESRFEFRNDSEPFSKLKNAPKPPWDRDEFLAYAKSGQYKNYYMDPHAKMHELAHPKESLELTRAMRVITQRNRLHLSIKNPWGRMPNPDQMFIITIDKSNVEGLDKDLLEIEIEMDRSSTETMDEMIAFENFKVPYGDEVRLEAVLFSKNARDCLKKDQSLLRNALFAISKKALQKKPLLADYKYKRLIKALKGSHARRH